MATRYLVLRTNVPIFESFQLTSAEAWSESTPGPSKLTIEAVEGHETDVGALRADPRNAVVLDADVALTLVEPITTAAATLTPTASAGASVTLKQVGATRMPLGLVAVGAHTTPFTGQGVTVAVLDTGIDASHPAFQGKTLATRDFTGERPSEQDAHDENGHGTHCAATICGAPVGDVRVGVAPGVVKLCAGRVLGKTGGTLEMLLRGMVWAVLDQKATVVSMSLAYDLPGNTKRLVAKGVDPALAAKAVLRQQSDISKGISTLKTFLESQMSNVVFVAASGNESKRPGFVLDAGLPAAELLAVGAVGPAGEKWTVATFSNGRAQLVAPGVDVLSAAIGGGWAVMSGTSMATPHAAGIAALWTQKLRDQGALAVPEAVRSAMRSSAVTQPLATSDVDAIGVGLVQAPQS